MAWTAKKVSILAGAVAVVAELGFNNAILLGFVYAGVSSVAAPVIVHGVVAAHDAEEARLAADRTRFRAARFGGHRVATQATEAGDADEIARRSDSQATDSPDMPRRLGPMLVARRGFLKDYEGSPKRAEEIVETLDKMLSDDQRAFPSFARHAENDPTWGSLHLNDIADLRAMDSRLSRLRGQIAAQ